MQAVLQVHLTLDEQFNLFQNNTFLAERFFFDPPSEALIIAEIDKYWTKS